jgi:hypothetical protein
MRFDASPAIGIRERKLAFLQKEPKAATTDWKQEWMSQHGRESMPEELAAESLEDGRLDNLGGLTRVKESTFGAVGNVLGGTGKLLFRPGQRFNGALQIGQGGLDALDIIPAAAADGIHMVTGPDSPPGKSPRRYNITRALDSFSHIDTKRPVGAVGAVADVVHASVFKLGSDALKAARQSNN